MSGYAHMSQCLASCTASMSHNQQHASRSQLTNALYVSFSVAHHLTAACHPLCSCFARHLKSAFNSSICIAAATMYTPSTPPPLRRVPLLTIPQCGRPIINLDSVSYCPGVTAVIFNVTVAAGTPAAGLTVELQAPTPINPNEVAPVCMGAGGSVECQGDAA